MIQRGRGKQSSTCWAELCSARNGLFFDSTSRVTVARDPEPLYAERGVRCHLVDVDGRRLLDLNRGVTTLVHGVNSPTLARRLFLNS